MGQVWNTATQLMENIDDTAMCAGSESYQAVLVFYNAAKQAASNDVPGAKAIYEEHRKRFPGGKRRTLETNAT
jgi:hypothetical protein